MRTEQLLQTVYDNEPKYEYRSEMPVEASERPVEHPKWAMDALLAYRNLLCAEDHIDELLRSPESTEEKSALIGMKHAAENLRSVIMPKEADSRYHCLTKHLSVAYEALREIEKAEPLNQDWAMLRSSVGDLLYESLEKLWGTKIKLCERCKGDGTL